MCGHNAETFVINLVVHIGGTTRMFRVTSQKVKVK
jgi:hypothetical protein